MNISVVYFSPTGTTKHVALRLAQTLRTNAPGTTIHETDLIDSLNEQESHRGHPAISSQEHADITIFAVPVFAGRVPAPAAKALSLYEGAGAPAVSVVVYGNREFDDALIEINDVLSSAGFSVIASGAFIAQHSMLHIMADGRPDAEDNAALDNFAEAIARKLSSLSAAAIEPASLAVPGNRPYKEVPPAVWRPITSDACSKCGTCATQCPSQAIPTDNPHTTGDECFQCMRCVHICPEQARSLPVSISEMISQRLSELIGTRKEPATWL